MCTCLALALFLTHFRLSAFPCRLPDTASPASGSLLGGPHGSLSPVRIPQCLTFISQHPTGSAIQRKHVSARHGKTTQTCSTRLHGYMVASSIIQNCCQGWQNLLWCFWGVICYSEMVVNKKEQPTGM